MLEVKTTATTNPAGVAGASRDDQWVLRVDSMTKVYRDGVVANDGISIDIQAGEVYGLLDPNGAGKTTLVNQTIGLLKPTSSGITLDGYDLVADPEAACQLCSYLPQAEMPIDSLRLLEAIVLAGMIRGGDRTSVRRRADELLGALDIEDWRDTAGMKLSGEVKRLAGFAMATAWPGRLVILDEPPNDIDPLRRRML